MSSSDSTPTLCAKNCGFYGSPANRNLCSKCYLDFVEEHISLPESDGIDSITSSVNQVTSYNENENENENDQVHDDSSRAAKNKSSRCLCCKKKIGLLGFACRCGGKFCSMHRYPEEHSCRFDYKTTGRVALARENPLVVHDKLGERV
ncbi:Zinc finger A20 and AN1 domain-containing stress-associated protein 9 [Heracleum sosnowskyi]|uniref:Zinc finger A20 and AN1 domain-containing stress-associated protein 9 n=1 Tax=Heracleum sosnowskyi TaxID=360622 RepID=A0AAD8N2V6_9APIA|nr:Zinc finger A20 and AN1 domain-containing stress-associated protein 9 [Heracleum sosnowskyi]